MPSSHQQRTIGTVLASVASGLVVGCIAFVFAMLTGYGFGSAFVPLGVLGIGIAFVMTCVLAYLVSAALGAAAAGSFHFTDPKVLALAMASVPISPIVVLFLIRHDWSLVIAPPFLAIGVCQGLGGYFGCKRSQSPPPEPERDIGTTCAECSYDLTATAQGKPCPECGGMMRLTPESANTRASSNAAEGA